MYNINYIRKQFMEMTHQIALCPHMKTCAAECTNDLRSDPPFPGFVGKRYRGLVIVGANPGPSNDRKFAILDKSIAEALTKFANNKSMMTYEDYLLHISNYMNLWKSRMLVNKASREKFMYDIEEVAQINIVKCRTKKTGGNVIRTCGTSVTHRCFSKYAKKQLELLSPKYIVCQWKNIPAALEALGYTKPDKTLLASYSGQLNLKQEVREVDIAPLFKKFREEIGETV